MVNRAMLNSARRRFRSLQRALQGLKGFARCERGIEMADAVVESYADLTANLFSAGVPTTLFDTIEWTGSAPIAFDPHPDEPTNMLRRRVTRGSFDSGGDVFVQARCDARPGVEEVILLASVTLNFPPVAGQGDADSMSITITLPAPVTP